MHLFVTQLMAFFASLFARGGRRAPFRAGRGRLHALTLQAVSETE